MITKILVDGEWVVGEPTDDGQQYRLYLSESSGYSTLTHFNKNIVEITIPNSGEVLTVGETLNFTGSFSDKTITGDMPVTIVNREGVQVSNVLISVVNGEGTGAFTPEKPLDYFITNEGINFHPLPFADEAVLTEEFCVRFV